MAESRKDFLPSTVRLVPASHTCLALQPPLFLQSGSPALQQGCWAARRNSATAGCRDVLAGGCKVTNSSAQLPLQLLQPASGRPDDSWARTLPAEARPGPPTPLGRLGNRDSGRCKTPPTRKSPEGGGEVTQMQRGSGWKREEAHCWEPSLPGV